MHCLSKTRFKASDVDRPEVQAFDCGTERWELEVSTWIKSRQGTNSVVVDMEKFGTEVWLYWSEQNELVGCASWGENFWSYPPPNGKKQKINYIPYMGIQKSFWGQPKTGNKNDQFSYQIIDDIIEYSCAKTHLLPVIGLSVDQGNARAIKFYESRGFVTANSPRQDKCTGVIYERMFLNITSLREASQPG
jgi:hypothetical protein